ncbi:MAG: PAS domain-containing sensor histidine kinase [Calditrichaeota bacterium]|nr:PAS domain-containing protein [Calditrichota bacterium]RQV92328.1 MAG: PAS domain-containing sensor histidine kinase [bacterium]RQV98271.1 MAG: PAS domain-containing sensor histidine kinase [Calditrichota bacterium]
MTIRQSFLKAHKKIIVDTALETLLTSNWVPVMDLREETSRKIFTEIFIQVDKDISADLSENGFQLASTYLNIFRRNAALSQNFSAQLTFLSIARIVLNHFLSHQHQENQDRYPAIQEKIQKIFDLTLLSLGQWWGDIYQDIREKDLQLIRELNIVKNDLQKQLDVIYQILKESPIATVKCDRNLNILHWNPAAVRLTGYTPADILKQRITGIFTHSSREKLLARLWSERKRVSNLRLYIQPKIGNPIYVLVSVSKIKSPKPDDFHYIFNLQELEKGTSGQEKSKRKMNELLTITRLSSAIIHDIRNPLNSIGLNLENLEQLAEKEGGSDHSPIKALLNKVQREIQQLSQNLQQYMAYGNLTELYLEPLNLTEKFKFFMDDISLEATVKKIKVFFENDGKEHWISGDWLQLNRVFMNILQNAFDVTRQSGLVRVRLSRRKDRVLVTVQDNGAGIPDAQRTKIFEPFYSTKKSGTGLGLFISREIIRAHGGRISHRPAKKGGTIFLVSLPVLQKGGESHHV